MLADNMHPKHRPIGVTLLALAFLWIGIGGATFVPIIILTGGMNPLWSPAVGSIIHSSAHLKLFYRALDLLLYLAYIAYAIIGFGLWKLKNWARICVLAIVVIGLVATIIIGPVFKLPILMAISIFGMAATELGWMGWYLLRPRVQNAFGAWKRYTPDGEWVQPPILSGRGRLGAGIAFTAIFVLVFLIPLAFAAAKLK